MLQHISVLLSLLRLPESRKGQAEASGDGGRPPDVSFEMCQLQAERLRGLRRKSHGEQDPRSTSSAFMVPSSRLETPLSAGSNQPGASSLLMVEWGMQTGSCVCVHARARLAGGC